jgi:hypothetical protein
MAAQSEEPERVYNFHKKPMALENEHTGID